jgi:pimeloyl-ACP methyl ester carboxylesterase
MGAGDLLMADDVFILIPGILGTVLQKDGRDVFGLTASAAFAGLFSGGSTIRSLRLDEPAWSPAQPGDEEPKPVPDLGDGITPDRLAADAHLLPGLWKIDGYTKIASFLKRRFALVPGETFFEFPYDWRRDNRAAAHALAVSARRWLAQRRKSFPDARLVLIGHSMGGLVARYYLEVLGGWRDTRKLITFGTPYRGSLNALDFAANGVRKAFGLVNLTDLMCSFTSVHQLLPIYPCIDPGTGHLARLTDTPELLQPQLTPGQIEAARAFHREIEEAVILHKKDPGYQDHGYLVRPVIGTEQPTYQSATLSAGRLEMLRTYRGDDLGGDGTVPRVAASPQEAANDDDAMFSSDKHASLQNADAVQTQIRGWLNNLDLGEFLARTPATVAVDAADVYEAGQPIYLTLTPSAAIASLAVSLTWVSGPGRPAAPTPPVSVAFPDAAIQVELPQANPGVYRLQVSGETIQTVSDLITIAPA